MTNQELLSEMVCDWMRENVLKYNYWSGDDLALDCACDLGFIPEYTNERDYVDEAPEWIVSIGDSIYTRHVLLGECSIHQTLI